MRTPVGMRVISPDPQRLDAVGTALRTAVAGIPGTRSVVFEALGGETWLAFDADPAAMARHGVDPAVVRSTVDLLTTGGQIGEIEHEGRRLRVRITPEPPDVRPRGPADELRDITVRATAANSQAPPDQPVPLALLGHPTYARRPAALRMERGELCAYVYVDLTEGTNVQGFVERAQREVDAAVAAGKIHLEPGERIEWTGQYDLLVAGQKRLKWIVPLVALSMLGLLFLQAGFGLGKKVVRTCVWSTWFDGTRNSWSGTALSSGAESAQRLRFRRASGYR